MRCPKCKSKLECEIFVNNYEIEEGMIHCFDCNSCYPIIKKIPIIWKEFKEYVAQRPTLGGILFNHSSDPKMKKFLKDSLSKPKQNLNDLHKLESHWTRIYQNNSKSKFYSAIKKKLDSIPISKYALEYGCSIGIITRHLSKTHDLVFGIDKSFSSTEIAKKTRRRNIDYFVADSLSDIFGKNSVGLVLALNMLELVEPLEFLNKISGQIENGFLIISDPYDYERGVRTVKNPLDSEQLRLRLKELGFQITSDTINPSFIPWGLKINPRTTINYKVDLVVARKL